MVMPGMLRFGGGPLDEEDSYLAPIFQAISNAALSGRFSVRPPTRPTPTTPQNPPSAAPANPSASVPVVPGQTKDDLEPSRLKLPPYDLGIPGVGGGYGFPEAAPAGTPGVTPSPPHIRVAVPFPETGAMGPMEDYNILGDPGLFVGGGGPPGTLGGGTPGGGAFSPSQMDWSKVANPEAFEDYERPIRDAARAAALSRAQRLAEDPMWEEREKAKIWAEAQGEAQGNIQSSIYRNMMKRAKEIEAEVLADDSIPPDKKQAEVQKRIDEMSMGLPSRPTTLSGFPQMR